MLEFCQSQLRFERPKKKVRCVYIFVTFGFSSVFANLPSSQPFPNPSGPTWCLNLPDPLLFHSLFWPIWAKRAFTKSCKGPIRNVLGAVGILFISIPSPYPVLSKAMWANWVFIPSSSNCFLECIWTYLDLWLLYRILLGLLKEAMWTRTKSGPFIPSL